MVEKEGWYCTNPHHKIHFQIHLQDENNFPKSLHTKPKTPNSIQKIKLLPTSIFADTFLEKDNIGSI